MSEKLREIENEIDLHLINLCAYVACGVREEYDMRAWLTDSFTRINKLDSWLSLWLYVKKEESNGL